MTEAVSIERLRELLDYDPTTGALTWRVRNSMRVRIGDEAGAPGANGRRYIGVDGYRILAHRIAWAMTYDEWPEGNVAPANGDYLDLALNNLKLETAAETARKGGLRKGNKSGSRGVSWDAARGKWLATITRDYRPKHLGRFATKEEAVAAFERAAEEYGVKEASDREAVLAEAQEEARRRGLWRGRWQRLRQGHPTTGWTSLEHFMETVGEAPTDGHKIVPANPEQMIGPDNFEWQIPPRPEFDQTTKEGRAALNRRYRKMNAMAIREKSLIRDFGITLADYQQMFIDQDGVCAICNQPEAAERDGNTKWLAVDHDHTLGKGRHSVRGLLCSNCNPMIGYGKDDPARLRAGADYLEAHARPDNVVPLKKDAC